LGIYDLINSDQGAVFSALTDVYRSLAGKKSLPAVYPQVNLPQPTLSALSAASTKRYGVVDDPAASMAPMKKSKKKSGSKKKSKKSKS
jgi:hypothetical protein